MEMFRDNTYRLQGVWRAVIIGAAVIGPVVLLLATVLQPWFEPEWMFMDVLTAARQAETCCHATFGFVSQIGLFLWVSAASFALFAALILHMLGANRGLTGFMLYGGLLSALLAMDDAFLLHESILPGFGIPQNFVLALYGLLGLVYAGVFRRLMLRTGPLLLGAAGMAVAASLAIDVFIGIQTPAIAILEDAFKFMGIALWAAFQLNAGAGLVLATVKAKLPDNRS